MLLSKKKIIVTGGSLGLGKTIAEHLVKAGADLMICSRNPGALQEALTELQSLSVDSEQVIRSFPCDVADRSEQTLNLFERAGIDEQVESAVVVDIAFAACRCRGGFNL